MQDEALNLSERLFSKVRKVQETSTISNSATELGGEGEQVLIEGLFRRLVPGSAPELLDLAGR